MSKMLRCYRRLSTLTKDRFPDLKRGSYAVLQDRDVNYFEKMLDKNQVLTDPEEIQCYNRDWLNMVCGYSSLVLKPKSVEEVSAILNYCNGKKLAVCPQGGNTGLVGGGVPVFDEIIISSALMNKIVDFNDLTGVLICQSGCVLEKLMNFVEGKGFIMPLDLGAKGSCHIGGNVSTNAGGLRLLRYGSLHSTVLGLQAVLANGEIIDNMNTLKKDNTGYHLKHLFIGSEGTLGFVTKVAIQCPPLPKSTNLALLGLENFDAVLKVYKMARSNLAEILSSCEVMDFISVDAVHKNLGISCPIPNLPFYVLIETSGSDCVHDEEKLNSFLTLCMSENIIVDGMATSEPSKMKDMWLMRESIAPALNKDGFLYTYDISIPLERFYDGVPMLEELLKHTKSVVRISCFGHLGDGNAHLNITGTHYDENVFELTKNRIYEWVSINRGSVSSEHGLGCLKKEAMKFSKTKGEILLMKTLKSTMDPNCILNPSKCLPSN